MSNVVQCEICRKPVDLDNSLETIVDGFTYHSSCYNPEEVALGASKISELLTRIDEYTMLERVPISEMFCAPYCRPVGASSLGRMLKAGFDPRALGIITLSMRSDGRFAILDGNHRRHMAENAGLTHLLSRVFIDLTYVEEAILFKKLNTIKPPTALDRYRSDLEADDAQAIKLRNVLAEYGLRIGSYNRGNAPGMVQAVNALQTIQTERGEVELREILTVLRAAWGYEPSAYSARMLAGLRTFWARYRSAANINRLVTQLQTTTPARIIAAALGSSDRTSTSDDAIGRRIADVYVGRSRAAAAQLPEWGRAQTLKSAQTYSSGRTVISRVEKARGKRSA